MKTSLAVIGLVAFAALGLCGCGTLSTRVKGDSGLYRGFAHDMEKVSSSQEWLTWSGQGSVGAAWFPWPRGLLWVVDAPLSLTADTLLLPMDCLSSKPAQPNAESEALQPYGETSAVRQSASVTNSTLVESGSREP